MDLAWFYVGVSGNPVLAQRWRSEFVGEPDVWAVIPMAGYSLKLVPVIAT